MENSGSINSILPQPTDSSNSEGYANASALNHSISSPGETLAKVHENHPDRADGPTGTAISSRAVESQKAPEPQCRCQQLRSKYPYYKCNFDPASYDRSARFEYWAERFLNIPTEEFLPISSKTLQRSREAYKRTIELALSKDDEFQMKIKWLLNKTLYDWQVNKNREQTKKQLTSLQNYCAPNYDISDFIENWMLMKTVRDMLYHKTVDEFDKQQLLLKLNDKLFDFYTDEESRSDICLEEVDLLPLSVFYFFGALPGFKDAANYEIAFHLLTDCHNTMKYDYQFFSLLSFSVFDYLRLTSDDLIAKLNEQKSTIPIDEKESVMWIIVMCFLNEHIDKPEKEDTPSFFRWLSTNKCAFDYYTFVNAFKVVLTYYQLSQNISAKTVRPTDVDTFLDSVTKVLSQSKKKQMIFGDSIGLFYHMKANIIKSTSKQKKRTVNTQLASLYQSAEELSPNHGSSTYYYYRQAGIHTAAAEAARRYANYLEGDDNHQLLAHHWSSLSDRELMLAEEYQQLQSSGQIADIDTDIQELPVMVHEAQAQSVKPAENKKKKQQKKNRSIPSANLTTTPGAGKKIKAESANSKYLSSKTIQPRLCRPIIKAIPFQANIPNRMALDSQAYLIKSKQGAIRPFEKLLSRYWNPVIRETLRSIREARIYSNSHREYEIYQVILADPKKKACIGIERIWEEYAWTKLHELDHCFRIQMIPASMRAVAKNWIKQAREYIMPCFAYCLELDQINVRIAPEAVWLATNILVKELDAKEPGDSREIRFRLRCLFSSMGHTCSLESMLGSENPDKSKHLMDDARKWYGYKIIDLAYDSRRKETKPD